MFVGLVFYVLLVYRDSTFSPPPLSPEVPIMEYTDRSLQRIHMGDVWYTVCHEKLSLGNTKCLSSLCKYNIERIVDTKDGTDYNPHGSDKVGFVL